MEEKQIILNGVYQCKNNEVIEVRFDNTSKKYKIYFQKGGCPELLCGGDTIKLLKLYEAFKYQD